MLGRQARQVLFLAIVKGFSNQGISDILQINIKTTDEYLRQVVQAARAKTRRQAYAFYAIRFNQENKDGKR